MDLTAVMFDLDGTLADTLRDIAEAGNHMLRVLGREPLPVQRYRRLAGQGLPALVRDALEVEVENPRVAQGVAAFREYYAAHRYDHTGLYDGIAQLLDALTQRGVTLAVLSNKPDDATRDMVGRLLNRWMWAAVRGHRPPEPLKPDPTTAHRIATQLHVPSDQWMYVGDTRVDMLTGKAAGFYTVGVTWGFRDEAELRASGADAIIHEPGDLLGVIQGVTSPAASS